MAFRRIILTTEKQKELEDDLNRLFNLSKTKIDFPDLKYYIKQGIKPNTLIIDLNGEGADSFSKKIKDSGIKYGADVQIKLEKTMEKNLKEVIKKILKENEYEDIHDGDIIYGFGRADGLVNQNDKKQFIKSLNNMRDDLVKDGFEVTDIITLLQGWVTDNIKQH